MKKQNQKTVWIAQTAALLALLLAAQFATKSLGQIVTGSCVNCILALSTLLVGRSAGLCIAVLSPVAAFLLGIGPAYSLLTPIIAVGNCVYVLLLGWPAGKGGEGRKKPAAVAVGALGKFAALYLLVVQGMCRLVPLKEVQVRTFTAMFSYPQLVTALIGGFLAVFLFAFLRKAIKKQG